MAFGQIRMRQITGHLVLKRLMEPNGRKLREEITYGHQWLTPSSTRLGTHPDLQYREVTAEKVFQKIA